MWKQDSPELREEDVRGAFVEISTQGGTLDFKMVQLASMIFVSCGHPSGLHSGARMNECTRWVPYIAGGLWDVLSVAQLSGMLGLGQEVTSLHPGEFLKAGDHTSAKVCDLTTTLPGDSRMQGFNWNQSSSSYLVIKINVYLGVVIIPTCDAGSERIKGPFRALRNCSVHATNLVHFVYMCRSYVSQTEIISS